MMRKKKRNVGTVTSSFGVSKREQHDSSIFYNSKLYEGININEKIPVLENQISPNIMDRIYCINSRNMDILPDSSIHLMVTSPPYNACKEYDENLTLKEYKQFLKEVFSETYRVLVSGGRACINIANVGRKPYIPYHSHIINLMHEIGFFMRGEIIWNKSASAGVSTAWGSWMSATNPTLRDVHEYILVFSKGGMGRRGQGRRNTISKEEFLKFTKSVWSFPAESARRVGHPAPFPVELPYRLIQFYTFEGDVVLDPFCGSGTTCIAALKTGRHFVGFDIDPGYVELSRRRIKEFLIEQKISAKAMGEAP